MALIANASWLSELHGNNGTGMALAQSNGGRVQVAGSGGGEVT